ncbi:DUF5107 domain-containing protein [Spirochaeta isovalerica]|uniref:Tetratricopeptide (TPR) repeat protein n=1 Tax=Spirochaeta isovalerica TaxID=150 RepID=A0A841RB17_9SPIO|nr:DUF5107 domain-containing protein [Spirochaeta isovalerica]MBB6481123.1 tetratricopeptide (TPR) repeat protein [Spirochaeta isovalerica]
MSVNIDKIKIPGSLPGKTNPLPMFRHRERNRPSAYDNSFLEKDKKLFAWETGFRVLPYAMQDSYTREKKELELKVIDLENEHLRARFLPDFGGRLISLFDKHKGKELLFSNPVFQPANLATRDAWFSGGIEWNISQFGHSYLTCEPVFFASVTDREENEFLRMYEYERNRGIFFSVDFHLPPGARQLGAHVRIVNDNSYKVPMYWWTNIALPEEKDIRVFSETDQVIYIKPESNISEKNIHRFGRASLTDLPSLPGKDASRPMNFTFSSEYFFQNPEGLSSPWEAAVYNDGYIFYERSTDLLLYRKMFCWGTHKGGRNWCDFLSEPGKGDYLEVQAGLAPTQLHGLEMPGETEWQFTQIFGSAQIEPADAYGDWKRSRDNVRKELDRELDSGEVKKRDEIYRACALLKPEKIIHKGSGWGALELAFRKSAGINKSIPVGMAFPESSMGREQQLWLDLLATGSSGGADGMEITSWMVDPRWEPLLRNWAGKSQKDPRPLILLGVLNFERGDAEEAVKNWQDSLSVQPTALAWRNLAIALLDWKKPDQALDAMRRAVALSNKTERVYLIRELMDMLIENRYYDEAWKYFKTLPDDEAGDERVMIPAAIAAFHKDIRDFLEKVFLHPFANIKEGETALADLWFLYRTRLEAERRGVPEDDRLLREIRKVETPPDNIDFTMTERD